MGARKFTFEESLAGLYPELAAQLVVEDGNPTGDQLLPGSGRKVKWQCPEHSSHVWEAVVGPRTKRGVGCPFCAGLRVEPDGSNSLAAVRPDLAEQLVVACEGPTASELLPGSHSKVRWRCPKNETHEWVAAVYSRVAGHGCPYCDGKLPEPDGSNALLALFPGVAEQLIEENGKPSAAGLLPSSDARRIWQCPARPEHRWVTSVKSRTQRGNGCPTCSGRVAEPDGSNSLATRHPQLAFQIVPEEGTPDPRRLLPMSDVILLWQCSENKSHRWRTAVKNRVLGKGCPFCCNKRLSPDGTNSLERVYPDVAAELVVRPGEAPADQVLAHSHARRLWRCAINPAHEWETKVLARTYSGTGCPRCNLWATSKVEIRLRAEFVVLLGITFDDIELDCDGQRWKVDLCWPSGRVVVEYDGEKWHRDYLERDIRKTRELEAAGWRVIRVREAGLDHVTPLDVTVKESDWLGAAKSVAGRIAALAGVSPDVRDRLLAYVAAPDPVGSALADAEITGRTAGRAA